MPESAILDLFHITEVELIYKTPVSKKRHKIRTSNEAYEVLKNAWDMNRIELLEQFKILLLDQSNNCLGISHISTGGTASCPVDAKIVFATALMAHASQIILAHNHPSGNPQASQADIDLTRRFYEAGKLLDIKVLDHHILTTEGYTSLSDQGMMPAPF